VAAVNLSASTNENSPTDLCVTEVKQPPSAYKKSSSRQNQGIHETMRSQGSALNTSFYLPEDRRLEIYAEDLISWRF